MRNVLKYRVGFYGIVIFLCALNFLWFRNIEFNSLMGDDLRSWNFYQDKGFYDGVLMNFSGNKYRPVFNLIQFPLFAIFKADYQAFVNVNMIFNCVIIFFVFLVLLNITKRNYVISTMFSCLYIFSQFSYYNIYQLFGLMEQVCLLFLVLIVFFSLRFMQTKQKYNLYLVFLFNLLIVFTHERYLCLMPFLLFFVLTMNLNLYSKIKYGLYIIFPLVLNIFLKTYLFKINFMEGTGGQKIGLDIISILIFCISGLLYMFGFNAGPAYLNGIFLKDVNIFTNLLCVTILLTTVFLIINFFKKTKEINYYKIISIGILFFALIGISSITIRQELRWIYAPYIIFLFIVAYLITRISSKKKLLIIANIFFLIVIKNDLYYRTYLSNVFFMYSQDIANSFYEETVQKYKEELPKYKIIVQKNPELDWPIAESMFLKQYYVEPFDLEFVDNINTIDASLYEENKVLILDFDFPKRKFINVTPKIKGENESRDFDIQKNLIDDYSKTTISPENTDLPTPNGKGVFILHENNIYNKGSNLTIISNYSVTFDNVEIGLGNKLFVSYYMPYESSDGAKVRIEIIDRDEKHIIYENDVIPDEDDLISRIDLQPYEGKNVSIKLSISSPSGDQTADWVSFENISLISE